jgi:hypothetical protein
MNVKKLFLLSKFFASGGEITEWKMGIMGSFVPWNFDVIILVVCATMR